MNGTQKDFDRQKEREEEEEYLTKNERHAEIVSDLRKSLRRYLVTKSKGGWTPEQCEMLSLEGLLDAAKHFAASEDATSIPEKQWTSHRNERNIT